MQKFKGQHHLRRVKLGVLLQKKALLAEVEKKFTAGEVFHHQEELVFRLKGTLQCHHKRVHNLWGKSAGREP